MATQIIRSGKYCAKVTLGDFGNPPIVRLSPNLGNTQPLSMADALYIVTCKIEDSMDGNPADERSLRKFEGELSAIHTQSGGYHHW